MVGKVELVLVFTFGRAILFQRCHAFEPRGMGGMASLGGPRIRVQDASYAFFCSLGWRPLWLLAGEVVLGHLGTPARQNFYRRLCQSSLTESRVGHS